MGENAFAFVNQLRVNYVASDGQGINLKCLFFVEKKTEKKVTAGL